MAGTRIALLLTALCATAACSDSSGPDLHGSPFFGGTVDGAAWSSGSVFAFRGDDALMISAAVAPLIPNTDLVEPHIGEATRTGSYSLGDSASGRSSLLAIGFIHRSFVSQARLRLQLIRSLGV